MAFEFPFGYHESFNPSIVITSESLDEFVKIQDSLEYLQAVNRTLKLGQLDFEINDEISSFFVGSLKFNVLETVMILAPNYCVNQDHVCTYYKGRILSFILSYVTQEHLDKVFGIFRSLIFYSDRNVILRSVVGKAVKDGFFPYAMDYLFSYWDFHEMEYDANILNIKSRFEDLERKKDSDKILIGEFLESIKPLENLLLDLI